MMNDVNMIGYIIGGIVLFFIAVGFIADKTGLIKKTFGKEVNNTKKKEENVIVPIVPGVTPVLEETEDNTVEQEIEQNDYIDFDNINNDMIEDVELSNSLVSLENIGDVDTEIATDEVSDIGDVDFSDNNTDEFMLNDNDNDKMLFDESSDSTDEFMLNDEDIVSNDSEMEDVSIDVQEIQDEFTENDDYSSDNTLDDEIENNSDSIVIDSNLDEIVLPDIEEIEDSEEDVWKF